MSLAEQSPSAIGVARTPWHVPRLVAGLLTLGLSLAILVTFAASVTEWTPLAILSLPLVALTALWISGGAAMALLGLVTPPAPPTALPARWSPSTRTAILVTLCKEDPRALARHLASLHAALDRAGLTGATPIFVLSDTSGRELVAREEAVMLPLHRAGVLHYRRRAHNHGRKPGNIGEWLDTHGEGVDHMLVLDADSRMSATRIARMIRRMETAPRLGLLQAGIAIRPGTTRFARHQRRAARLLSRGFGRGFAAWSGESGNYWGHNALIRVAAFRAARNLPVLSGAAPWGGPVLSHDFIEAAWIRRAGWAVALDPDTDGSAEGAPETLGSFRARDRRWCQGNLQHLRLIVEPGLDPVSRMHLALGVLSYLSAPIWLALIALVALGGLPSQGAAPLAIVLGVLLLPKLAALLERMGAARTSRRRRVYLQASIAELAISSLISPLVMLRQAAAVLSVCLGRDCGWKTGTVVPDTRDTGLPEAAFGWSLVAVAVVAAGPAAAWLAPVALPLCVAPFVLRIMDAPA